MWFQFIDAMYNWFETLSLDDMKYYVWGNSVWHTRRFDTATGRTPVCPTLISCSTSRVTLDVLGTGQHFYHLCCWNLYKYLCIMTAILGSIFKRTWIWPIIIHDVSTIQKKVFIYQKWSVCYEWWEMEVLTDYAYALRTTICSGITQRIPVFTVEHTLYGVGACQDFSRRGGGWLGRSCKKNAGFHFFCLLILVTSRDIFGSWFKKCLTKFRLL